MDAQKNTDSQPEKKMIDPDSKTLNVSSRREARSYFFIAKLILKKFGELELQSLGKASGNVVRVAQFLENNNLAVIQTMGSDIVEVSDRKTESGVKSELSFLVSLKKSDRFDELTADLK